MPVKKTKLQVGTANGTSQAKSTSPSSRARTSKPKDVGAVKVPSRMKVPGKAKAAAPKTTAPTEKMAAKAKKVAGKVGAQKMAVTGLTSRIRGHVSARGRRAQAARNER